MQDASSLEKALFNWFSRRSDFVLVTAPIAIFVAILGIGLVALASLFHRSFWPSDFYLQWLLVLAIWAAVAMYLTAIVALESGFMRSRRFRLLELHQTMRDIQAMSWREFEDLVVANYVVRGYAADHVGSGAPDGGVDVVLRKDGKTWLVQCKHYRDQWVGERPLREFLGLVASRKADGGIFVACGVFDDKALAFAKANSRLQLIGGQQLRDLVEEAVRSRRSTTTTLCPICGGPMRDATGRYGQFLGCANFPACKGWRPLPGKVQASK